MDTTMESGSFWPPLWGLKVSSPHYASGGFSQPLWGLMASVHYYGTWWLLATIIDYGGF